MSTTKSQRIGIIIIAIVMTVGTIGSFFIMIVANNNAQREAAQSQQDTSEQQKQYEEYQKQQQALAKKLSPTYYPVFHKYEDTPAPFDASKVKTLSTNDLKKGDGKEVESVADLNIYYMGWDASGKVFDSSLSGDSLKAPLDPSIGLIAGMTKGIIGMKLGGVRQITIPAEQAYGENAPEGYPSGPLKFIVLAIPPQDQGL